MRAALLDRRPQRRALAEQVRLADELLEAARANLDGQWPATGAMPIVGRLPSSRGLLGILAKQGVHAPEYRVREQSPRLVSREGAGESASNLYG